MKNFINKAILNNKIIAKLKTFKNLKKNLLIKKKVYYKNLFLLLLGRLYMSVWLFLGLTKGCIFLLMF
jgi:hypothetical protein